MHMNPLMNTYRKTFTFDGEFPFVYVYRDAKSAENELPNHVHDWYEFVYVYSGRGTFFIDHTFYDAVPGDIFLIPGNTIHRSFPLDEDPKRATAFYFSAAFVHTPSLGDAFSYLQPFETATSNQAFRLTLPEPLLKQIEASIEMIHLEYNEEQVGYRQAIRLNLQQILLLIGRFEESMWSSAPQRQHIASLPEWITEILPYIDAHLSDELSLSALAKKSAVTPAHFSRVFKRLTGMNVTDYVNAKRIMRAKQLLEKSHMSIAEIGERCGFISIPHFHRKFKEVTGTTPSKYKRNL